jgi:sensor histidine kinase YesM
MNYSAKKVGNLVNMKYFKSFICIRIYFTNFTCTSCKRTKPELMPTNAQNITTKLFGPKDKINDIGIRVVLVPLFGIAIPLITQMVPHDQFSNWQIKLSYLYTISIAFVIYEGVRFLQFTLRSYFDWLNKPLKKILAFIITIPFYVVPVSVLMLVGWYKIFMNGVVDWNVVRLSSIIILIAVFFLVNLYETVFLVRDVANDKLEQEQLVRAKAEAELEALKNQIDPHFILNSLNTLSHLIEEKPEKAKLFNDHMADVYRYILQNKAKDLVLLRDEMQFMQDYFSLLKIRFEDALQLETKVDETLWDQYLIPPISLQVLLENAVKHNEFSETSPLQIQLVVVEHELQMRNRLKEKKLRKPSSRIGLQNLEERYRLSTGKSIRIEKEEDAFTVCLPILKID